MEDTKNTRGQYMSASSMKRYTHCPASFLRGRWMPDTTSEAAERGTRIHDAIDKGEAHSLEHSEAILAEQCEDISKKILENRGVVVGKDIPDIATQEERVQTLLGMRKFSGQWDRFHYYSQIKSAFVFDWKTGPRGAESAEQNEQLASLAVLADQKYDLPGDVDYYVVLVHPMKSPQYTMAVYRKDQLRLVLGKMHETSEACHDPYAPANAGEHCRYCPARRACPEYNAITTSLEPMANASALMINPREFVDRLNLGDICVTAHKEDRELAKQLLIEGKIELPGWKIQERKGRQKITPKPLLQKMGGEGYRTEMLGTMVSVTKKGLLTVVKTKTGLAGKALDQEVDRLLEGCSEDGAPTKSLVKE